MISTRLEFAIEAATKGAAATLEHFQKGIGWERKSDDSPVTIADHLAEQIIRDEIAKHFPGETILGEEQGLTGEHGDRWVIDPIDGTKSFAAGAPLYATLLSYEMEDEPVLGVCVLPALNEVYAASKGEGAYLNGVETHVREASLEDSIICTGSIPSLIEFHRMNGMQMIGERVMAVRGWGDAYGHMMVAAGRAQAMIDPIVNHWDISAPSIIVREAGGCFTDFHGGETLAHEGISCTPGLQRKILEAFQA
jgi:myo-inositol-1(or 4)-monophosphatase